MTEGEREGERGEKYDHELKTVVGLQNLEKTKKHLELL